MARTKKVCATAILSAIIILFAFTTIVDLSRFFGAYEFYDSYPNDLIKRIGVLLAAALVWMAGKDSLSQKDNRHMKLVFIVICVGEVFFLLARPDLAIAAFAVCQSLLILRHSKGLKSKLSGASIGQKVLLAIRAFILASVIIVTFIILDPIGEYGILAVLAAIYWSILSTSLWTAQANADLGLLPSTNSRMAALGMTLFYFCDICVGTDRILYGGTEWLLANSFIWIFYTPAITLLALSCYKYSEHPKKNKILLNKTRALK